MASPRVIQICVTLIGIIQLAHCAYLRLCCITDSSPNGTCEEQPLSKAELLLDSQCYNKSRTNICTIPGFTNKVNGVAPVTIMNTVMKEGVYNTFLLNWEEEASSIFVTNISILDTIFDAISYVISAVPNALKVAYDLAIAYIRMAKHDYSINNTWLVGHSLGAQLAGHTGKTVLEKSGEKIGLIWGLDAAGPLFGKNIGIPPLNKANAELVYCIYSDPGNLGTNETSNCLINYLINYNYFTLPKREDRMQPGCQNNASCNHNLAWQWWCEGLTKNLFWGTKAKDVYDWQRNRDCSDTAAFVKLYDKTKSGTYFLNTSATPPYSLGLAGAGCP